MRKSMRSGKVRSDGGRKFPRAGRACGAEELERRVLLSSAIAAFAPQVTIGVGANPFSVAVADLNRDGRGDLIVANLSGNNLGVLLGNGNGTFQTQITYAAGTSPISVVASDVNGDGKIDLVCGNLGSNSVSVLLGNGDGTFQAQKTFDIVLHPRSVAVADLNSDGKPDIVVADGANNTVSVLLGNGDGSFGGQKTFGAGAYPHSIAVWDVNGDGKPDLLTANAGGNSAGVLLGNGDGTFAAQQTFGVGTNATCVVPLDANGDGKVDLVVTNYNDNSVSVLAGNGDGTFKSQRTFSVGAAPIYVSGSDANADGKLDLLVVNFNSAPGSVSVLLGNGDGTFGAQTTFGTGSKPRAVAAGDLNGDGRVDLVVANDNAVGTVSALLADVPVVKSIVRGNPSNALVSSLGSVSFAVTFNEPVTGVDAGDFSILAQGVNVSPVPVVTGSGAAYTVTVNGITGGGSLGLKLVDDGSIHNLAGNPLQRSGAVSFAPQQNLTPFGQPFAMTVADFNGDGKPDLAQNDFHSGITGVQLGNGDGTFMPARTFNSVSSDFVAAADMNLDGKTDLVMSIANNGTLLGVWLGNGDGTFQNAIQEVVARYANAGVVADVNGDGKPDVVVAYASGTSAGSTVSVLLGNGDGSLQSPLQTMTGGFPTSVAVADVNGDGKPDLVVAEYYQGGDVRVLLGNGNGTFGFQQVILTGSGTSTVALGDLNGDGILDAVVTRGIPQTAIGDAQQIVVLTGNGNGNFHISGTFSAGRSPRGICLADLTGDGKLDVVLANFPGGVGASVLVGNGDGSFQPLQTIASGGSVRTVVVADVNRDGRPDVLAGDTTGNTVSVMLNNTQGDFVGQRYTIRSTPLIAFGPQATFGTGSQPFGVVIGDVNRDGRPDLIVGSGGGNSVSVALGNGNGTFLAAQSFAVGMTPFGVAVGDVNNDGKPDLVVANNGSGSVSVLLGNGNGAFLPQQTFASGTQTRFVAVADFNGDGRADIATANYGANTVGVLLGNGNGTFQGQRTFSVGIHPSSLAVADFNSDGRMDLVVANKGSNNIGVLLGMGNGSLGTQLTFASGVLPFSVSAGDLNGDGRVDVVVAEETSNAVGALLGNGNGSFAAQQTFATGSIPAAVGLADLNGDGRLDVLVANYSSNTMSVLLGNGNGALGIQSTFVTGTSPFALAVSDLNLDGRLDVVVANDGAGTVSVFLEDLPPRLLSINRAVPTSATTTLNSVSFTVTFSEPVTGVDAGDFSLVLGGVGTAAPVVSGGPSVYTVTVGGITGVGTVGLNLVDNGTIKNGVGDPLQPGGTAVFGAQQPYAAGTNGGMSTVADINHDGKLDVLVGGASAGIMLGNGDGTFQTMQTVATAGAVNFFVAAADVNGDGNVDLLVTHQVGNAIGVLAGNGSGTFQAEQTFTADNAPESIMVSDLNRDGKLDLAVVSQSMTFGPTISILLGNGNGTFTTLPTKISTTPFVTISEVNGDGIPDLLISNNPSSIVRVLLGNGDGTFGNQRTFATSFDPYSIASSDVNGDGKADIVVALDFSNAVGVLLGNGDGTFQAQHTFGAGPHPVPLALADVNGDGRIDIVAANIADANGRDGTTLTVLLGNGDGTFQTGQTVAAGPRPYSVTAADLNGDGRLDLVTLNRIQGQPNVGVLLAPTDASLAGPVYTIKQASETISGTPSNDQITLMRDPDGLEIDWNRGTASGQLPANDVNGLTINSGGGNDNIFLNNVNGNALPNLLHLNGTFTINGFSNSNPFSGTTLEIGQSTVYFDYTNTTTPAAAILAALSSGYNNDAWNGSGAGTSGAITSSAAAGGPVGVFGIGYADSADGIVVGQPANTVEIRYTVMGDANLDRVVNSTDAVLMARNYLGVGKSAWDLGNFNYDTTINLSDATILQKNFNATATGSVTAAVAGLAAVGGTPVSAPTITTLQPLAPQAGLAGGNDGLAGGIFASSDQHAKDKLKHGGKLGKRRR